MILVDHQLQARCDPGPPVEGCDPEFQPDPPIIVEFDPKMVRPASIDHRLGNSFRIPKAKAELPEYIDLLDIPNQNEYLKEITIGDDEYVTIRPGGVMLACTKEWFNVPTDLAMTLDGRSSIGRIWMAVHVTAGYFDPGFQGIGTLELVNFSPIPLRLRPGTVICQSRWFQLAGVPYRTYADQYLGKPGRYFRDTGAVGSRYGSRRPGL